MSTVVQPAPSSSSVSSSTLISYMDDSDFDDSVSDVFSTSSFTPFAARSIVSSQTSHEASMRSQSPAPSVFSMTDSLRERAYRQEFGRGLNNYSDIYSLPADDEEFERLDNQHKMFIEVMGKYPPPLPGVMADDVPGELKAALDLGCGSGSWIMDIAREFPHCSAVAVDLVPMQSTSLPPNCRSEVDDINLGLEHFYGDFNLVHAQLIASGIRDYAALVDQTSRVLRPGGLLQLIEFDFRVYTARKQPFFVPMDVVEGPWLPRWMAMLHMAARQRGGHVDAANLLETWVKSHPAFENAVYHEYWFPTSPWLKGHSPEIQRMNRVGSMMRQDILAFLKSGRPLLLGSGLDEQVVDLVETNAHLELERAQVPGYIRVQAVYASRKHDDP